MEISYPNVIEVRFTEKEKNSLKEAYNLLDAMRGIFYHKRLTSPTTGEVIVIDEEIPRVLGILSGFIENDLWEKEWKS